MFINRERKIDIYIAIAISCSLPGKLDTLRPSPDSFFDGFSQWKFVLS